MRSVLSSLQAGVARLNDAMRERDDYDEDLQALHKLMDRATKDRKEVTFKETFAEVLDNLIQFDSI